MRRFEIRVVAGEDTGDLAAEGVVWSTGAISMRIAGTSQPMSFGIQHLDQLRDNLGFRFIDAPEAEQERKEWAR